MKILNFLLAILCETIVLAAPFSMSQQSNRFGISLFKKLVSPDKNGFISPISIYFAFGMAYEGSAGKTAEEFEKVLYISFKSKNRLFSFLKAKKRINEITTNCTLKMANALWPSESSAFNKDFINIINKYYGGYIQFLNYAKEYEKSRLLINDWVSQKTNGKINDILPENSINRNTVLVITNAIYFFSEWKEQFDQSLTQTNKFYQNPDTSIDVEMMHKDGNFNFSLSTIDHIQILEIPYKENDLTMYIILPEDPSSLLSKLCIKNIKNWISTMNEQKVLVYIPKFIFDTKYELKEPLTKMGLKLAFSDNANFQKILYDKSNLYISKAIHQAFVAVDEKGTEAAAATVISISDGASMQLEPVFYANKPFLFLIMDKQTESILFIGYVYHPKS